MGVGRHGGWAGEKQRILSRHLTRHHVWRYYNEGDNRGLWETMDKWKTTRMDLLLDELKASDEGNVGASWWDEDSNWVIREDSGVVERAEFRRQEQEYRRQVREATAKLHSKGLEVVLDAVAPVRQWQAWLRSSEYQGSGRWLYGISSNLKGEFEFINDVQYRMAMQFRLLVEPAQPSGGKCPLCHAQNIQPLHLLDCGDAQWFWTRRHEAVKNILARFILSTGSDPELEPLLEDTSNTKGDICYARTGTAPPILIDVTIADATAQSYSKTKPHLYPDAVANFREEQKRKKYDRFKDSYEIVPFVVEATGRLGPAARKWLQQYPAPRIIKTRLREQISCKVMQFNIRQMITLQNNIVNNSRRNFEDSDSNNNSPRNVENSDSNGNVRIHPLVA